MRKNTEDSKGDNNESAAWLKKTYGAWLGAQKIDSSLEKDNVWFTYSIKYVVQDELVWEHRLDNYFMNQDFMHKGISWWQMTITVLVLIFMTVAVVWALRSALNKDTMAIRQ